MASLIEQGAGQTTALLGKLRKFLGPDAVERILDDRVTFEWDNQTKIEASKLAEPLFDSNGRAMVPKGFKPGTVGSPIGHFEKPISPLPGALARFNTLKQHIATTRMSYAFFLEKTEQMAEQLQQDPRARNLLKGTCLPLAITSAEGWDLPNLAHWRFMAAQTSVRNYFGNREFTVESFFNKLLIAPHSRYEQLLWDITKDDIAALYFPGAFHGYSIQAQRQLIKEMPPGLILSGPIDLAHALIMYPDIVGTTNAPFSQCSATAYGPKLETLCLQNFASLSRLVKINNEEHIPLSGYSGGLLYISPESLQ